MISIHCARAHYLFVKLRPNWFLINCQFLLSICFVYAQLLSESKSVFNMNRDVAKEKLCRFLISLKLAFLLNCSFKITPRLCFPEQFELMVSSLSAGKISCQLGFIYICPCESLHSLKIMYLGTGAVLFRLSLNDCLNNFIAESICVVFKRVRWKEANNNMHKKKAVHHYWKDRKQRRKWGAHWHWWKQQFKHWNPWTKDSGVIHKWSEMQASSVSH